MTEIIAVPSRRAPVGAVKMQLSIATRGTTILLLLYTSKRKKKKITKKKNACALRLFSLKKPFRDITSLVNLLLMHIETCSQRERERESSLLITELRHRRKQAHTLYYVRSAYDRQGVRARDPNIGMVSPFFKVHTLCVCVCMCVLVV